MVEKFGNKDAKKILFIKQMEFRKRSIKAISFFNYYFYKTRVLGK